MATTGPTPVPTPALAPTPRATATTPSAVPPTSVNPNYVQPKPVPRSQIDTSPGSVPPGPGIGVSANTVTIAVPTTEISLDTAATSTVSANTVQVSTGPKPGGSSGALQFNSSGTFGGVSGWDVNQGVMRVQTDMSFITPGSSAGSERYITFKTPGLSTVMAWGTYANSILGEGPAFQWYGPSGGSSLFYTNLLAGNIVFPNGGDDWNDVKPPYGMMIGSDLKFYNSKNATPSAGHVGVYYSDGTYQYTTVKASNEGTQISNSVVGLNFVGAGVTATNSGGNITITIPGGDGANIAVFDETTLVTANVSTFVFRGNGVAVGQIDNETYVEINGGTSGIAVQEEGTNVVASANTVNFVGTGVTASNVAGVATVTINTTNVNTVYDAGSANTVTLNYNNGQWQNYTPSGSTVDITVSNIPTGGEMTIFLQTGAANTAIAWHAATAFFWEGGVAEPSVTSGTHDVITIKNNGSYYFGKVNKGYVSA